MNYRWPTKIMKFGIDDPLLKIIVAKYENEIPWQVRVKSQDDLFEFVSAVMLPKVCARIAWPPTSGVKHCFVSAHDLDLSRMLDVGLELDSEDIEIVRLLRDENGVVEASEALAYIINKNKLLAFEEWTDLLEKKYIESPAFSLLVLRPILETSGPGSWRTVIPVSEKVIEWLLQRLMSGSLSPAQNFAKVYADKLSAGFHGLPTNGWQYIPKLSDPAQLVGACRNSGWCLTDRKCAAQFLKDYDFYLLRIDNRAKVALRVETVERQTSVVECQGTFNSSPRRFLSDIHLFIRSMGFHPKNCNHDMGKLLSKIGDIHEQPSSWWAERELYWPFARQCLPPAQREHLPPLSIEKLTPYLHFPQIDTLLANTETTLTKADWVSLVEIDPCIYMNIPILDRSRPEVLKACCRGWIGQFGVRDVNVQALHAFLGDAGATLTTEQLVSFVELRPALYGHMPVSVRADPVFLESCLRTYVTQIIDESVNNNALRFFLIDAGKMLTTEGWVKLLGLRPTLFKHVPLKRQSNPDIFEACFRSWINQLNRGNFEIYDLYDFLIDATTMLTTAHWVKFIHMSPFLYKRTPAGMRSHPEIFHACVRAWINKVDQGEMDMHGFVYIPFVVRQNEEFQISVKAKYPDGLPRFIKPSPEAWRKYLPSPHSVKGSNSAVDEYFVITVVIATNSLLDGWPEDSSDTVFEEKMRSRDDFSIVRQEAWSKGIERCPALWLALPDDLCEALDFKPQAGGSTHANLGAWVHRIYEKPWMLGRENAVPKSVRFHEIIFDACLRGWLNHFTRSPWRLYVHGGVNLRDKFKIPLAICERPFFVDGVADALRQRRNHVPDAWARANETIRQYAWYQVAMLRAIEPSDESGGIRRVELKIAADIAKLAMHSNGGRGEKYGEEIRNRLHAFGFDRLDSAA